MNASLPVIIAIVVAAVVLGTLVSALFVSLGTRIVCGFFPAFSQALSAAFCAALVGIAFVAAVRYFLGETASELVPRLIEATFGLLLQTSVFGNMVKDPQGEAIGFGKAFLVIVVQALLILGIVVAVTVAFPEIARWNAVTEGG